MTTQNAKTALAAKPQTKEPKNMVQWIEAMKPEIQKALPFVITAERFSRMALTAIRVNPKLAESTPASFMGALMQAAQLGLEPNTPLGQAYLIPSKNKGVDETRFEIGYKGLIDLAHRSGQFQVIYAQAVHAGDRFDYEFGLEPKLEHKPSDAERGEVTHYYAVYRLVNGGFGFEVMSKADVAAHAKKFSKSFTSYSSPWQTDFDEMAKKTVLKKVLKYAPIKVEFARELAQDNTIKTEIADNMADVEDKNVFDVTDYSEVTDGEETEPENPFK